MAKFQVNSWAEIAEWEGVIRKVLQQVLGANPTNPDLWQDLWMEACFAVHNALQRYDSTKGDLTTWIFQRVFHHLRRVLSHYLPLGQPLEEDWLPSGRENPEPPSEEIHPIAIAVLLALAPPLERLYVLHELLGWEKPPRYCKARLKRRWQHHPWVRLVLHDVRHYTEREQMLHALCYEAREGDERAQEIAGFALIAIAERELSEREKTLVRDAAQSLLQSPYPLHQLVGLWILHQFHPEPWDRKWIDKLEINSLGAVLESRYAKPPDCFCPSPLCLHYHPDVLQRRPSLSVSHTVAEALQHYAQTLNDRPNWDARWRGRLMAKALGLYCRVSSNPAHIPAGKPSRAAEILVTFALARVNPQIALEQAQEWLPKAQSLLERLLKAIRSPEPLERSSALYAARGLPPDERLTLACAGITDPLVFVRFSVLRTLGEATVWETLERELVRSHEHKRLLHRCILNTLARMDLERVLQLAKQVYLGQGKAAWHEDAWLRHDAGYILLWGVLDLHRQELLEAFRQVLEREPHPYPFALLPAVIALR